MSPSRPLARWRGGGSRICVASTAWHGSWLASASEDGTSRIWELPGGKLRHVLRTQKQGVFTVDFSPDSRTLGAGGQDGTVTLWNVETGRFLATLRPSDGALRVGLLRFNRDGNSLAALLGDDTLQVWRAPRGH